MGVPQGSGLDPILYLPYMCNKTLQDAIVAAYLSVRKNNQLFPHVNTANYFGVNLVAKLGWNGQMRQELEMKCWEIGWLIGRKSSVQRNSFKQIISQTNMNIWYSIMGLN